MTPCPSCGAALDQTLACGGCGSRFSLVAASTPGDPVARLLASLGAAGTEGERGRIRSDLSRVLAEHGRDDLLLAVWADIEGPEADLWRGASAVIAQPGTATDGVAPLERALAAFLAAGRRDLVAVARAYLVQAYGAARRIADAEQIGDAALVAAIEERDAVAVVRSAASRHAAADGSSVRRAAENARHVFMAGADTALLAAAAFILLASAVSSSMHRRPRLRALPVEELEAAELD